MAFLLSSSEGGFRDREPVVPRRRGSQSMGAPIGRRCGT